MLGKGLEGWLADGVVPIVVRLAGHVVFRAEPYSFTQHVTWSLALIPPLRVIVAGEETAC